jgi:hypothetical protein
MSTKAELLAAVGALSAANATQGAQLGALATLANSLTVDVTDADLAVVFNERDTALNAIAVALSEIQRTDKTDAAKLVTLAGILGTQPD